MDILDEIRAEMRAANEELKGSRKPKQAKSEPEAESKKEAKFNGAKWIVDKLEGKYCRCSISGRVFCTETLLELSEKGANSLYLNLKMIANIKKDDLWTYLASDFVPTRLFIREFWYSLSTKSDCIQAYFSALVLANKSEFEMLYGIFRKWLIGVVAQGCEKQFFPNIICPVLIGDVSTGKTSFFKKLFFGNPIQSYASVQRIQQGFDKDAQTAFSSYLIICADDLDKSDFRKSSGFRTLISADSFNFRAPFARNFEMRNRIGSLCGTTNERDIISDAQNNRRIIPISITGIDFAKLNAIDYKDIWSSAYQAYLTGEDWVMTPAEIAFIQKSSLSYTPNTGISDYIGTFITPCPKPLHGTMPEGVFFAHGVQLWQDFITPSPDFKDITLNKFTAALKEIGFIYDSKTQNGKTSRGFYYKIT